MRQVLLHCHVGCSLAWFSGWCLATLDRYSCNSRAGCYGGSYVGGATISLIPRLISDQELLRRANGLFASVDGLVIAMAPFLEAGLLLVMVFGGLFN